MIMAKANIKVPIISMNVELPLELKHWDESKGVDLSDSYFDVKLISC